jgi:hypothetical protein
MLFLVVTLRKAREAVADAKRTVNTSMIVAVIALVCAVVAMFLGVKSHGVART